MLLLLLLLLLVLLLLLLCGSVPGSAWLGLAWLLCSAWLGLASVPGLAKLGLASVPGLAWLGLVSVLGLARLGAVLLLCSAWLGLAWLGLASVRGRSCFPKCLSEVAFCEALKLHSEVATTDCMAEGAFRSFFLKFRCVKFRSCSLKLQSFVA